MIGETAADVTDKDGVLFESFAQCPGLAGWDVDADEVAGAATLDLDALREQIGEELVARMVGGLDVGGVVRVKGLEGVVSSDLSKLVDGLGVVSSLHLLHGGRVGDEIPTSDAGQAEGLGEGASDDDILHGLGKWHCRDQLASLFIDCSKLKIGWNGTKKLKEKERREKREERNNEFSREKKIDKLID